MTRSSVTKKALFISTCALLFSMLMMAGSTFAWFTDSVSTGSNRITTGSLKVELLHTSAKVTVAKSVDQGTLLFTDKDGNAMSWEPGAVAYENFTVKNEGDLALDYRLTLDFNNANTVKDTSGTSRSLKDVLQVKVVKGGVDASDIQKTALESAQGAQGFTKLNTITGGQLNIPAVAGGNVQQIQTLKAKGSDGSSSSTYGVILYWKPEPDTDYNYNLANYPDKDNDGKPVDKTSDGKAQLSIDLGISLGATQAMDESDSNGTDYDKDATYPAGNAAELKNALGKAGAGSTIELTGNIALSEDLAVDKNVTIRSVGGAVISGGALEIGSNAAVTLEGITFKSPRSSDNKGVSLKTADSYAGSLTIKGCKFEAPQWSCIEIDNAAAASVRIKDCTFAVSEASGSAGHRYVENDCSITEIDDKAKAQLKAGSKLAAGAHRALYISGTGSTKLVMTGNIFTGLANCDAAEAVEITGIAENNMTFENNTLPNGQQDKISIAYNSNLNGFTIK